MKRRILGFLIVIMGIVSMACGQSAGDYTSKTIGVLKYVPTGTFQRDEKASNTSTVNAFRMSQHEITRNQFLAIMGVDPSEIKFSSGMNDPVQSVNWYHALAFCNKLSMKEGLTPVYSVTGVNFTTLTYDEIPTGWGDARSVAWWDTVTANWSANGYRLPTEMEWMWAAMGADTADPGKVNTTGYAKAFAGSTGSNDIVDYAWLSGNSSNKTHPAGTKLPNELGLYDMSGNVWEWCWDWYDTYPTGSMTDYLGAASGSFPVYRGYGWSIDLAYCNMVGPVAGRGDYYCLIDIQVLQIGDFGFRVVRR